MAMYQIKSWLTGAVLFECDVPDAHSGMTVRFALEDATQSRADLSSADLSSADLSSANLSSAKLSSAKLYGADLSRADLSGANLYGANLYGANLSSANLSGAKIDGEEIKKPPVQIGGLTWHVLITEGFMRIGCQRHSHAAWDKFGPDEIRDMAGNATEFWGQWKAILLSICKEHAIDKN